MGRRFPVSVGRGGIVPAARKREGDGATPAGVHVFQGMLYRATAWRGLPTGRCPSGPPTCGRMTRRSDYNLYVRAPHGFSHERLMRADPMYGPDPADKWKWPQAEPGRGSASSSTHGGGPARLTAGCVALRPPTCAGSPRASDTNAADRAGVTSRCGSPRPAVSWQGARSQPQGAAAVQRITVPLSPATTDDAARMSAKLSQAGAAVHVLSELSLFFGRCVRGSSFLVLPA